MFSMTRVMEQIALARQDSCLRREHDFQWIHVRNIQAFDRDPRRLANPDFDRVRDSIRLRGMEQPLVVARAEERDIYVLQVGGITRLKALVSLYEATGDLQYSLAPCLVSSQLDEADTIISHLQSNWAQAGLTFYERSRAVMELWSLLSAEKCRSQLSKDAFLFELRLRGFALGAPALLLMVYAVDRLETLIPKALRSGLDREAIGQIRSLEVIGGLVWNRFASGEGPFGPVFEELLKRCDGPDWDHASLVIALEAELAMAAEISPELVRVQLWEEQFPARKHVHAVALDEDRQDTQTKPTLPRNLRCFSADRQIRCEQTPKNEPSVFSGSENRVGVYATNQRFFLTFMGFRIQLDRWLGRFWDRLDFTAGTPARLLYVTRSPLLRLEIYGLPLPAVVQLWDSLASMLSLGLWLRGNE